MTVKKNRQWLLKSRPVGLTKESDFEMVENDISGLKDGEILIRNIYLSLDPTNRGWMNPIKTYVSPVKTGSVMRGIGIGIVEESKNSRYSQGTIVTGLLGWQDYARSDGSGWLTIIPSLPNVPLPAFLNLYGMIGLTAYFGLLEIGEPKEGETLVISAAAGAVGSLVGQIGKIKGCRVIGIAGTDEKCNWLTNDLGFDAAINYKSESVFNRLKDLCPEGIDIYFANVGGKILDAALGNLNLNARVIICGLISQYNATERMPGPYNFANILLKRASVTGFLVTDYLHRMMEAIPDLHSWHTSGKLHYREEIVDGLENAPKTFNKLFDGSNKGKLIIKIFEEPTT
ncbi:NADP-dependent oxidoreductase [Candidatus Heimdallarchaeota archaeon B3_Heim]|nr:MAG: NADP-dependent oxidoreductase [Candidatus Heimdallarchaeota archaeon B3_Heim]